MDEIGVFFLIKRRFMIACRGFQWFWMEMYEI